MSDFGGIGCHPVGGGLVEGLGVSQDTRNKVALRENSGEPIVAPSSTEHPLYEQVVEACRTVHDPEIPVNIYDLGLIYEIIINPVDSVLIRMSLTAPNCPVADILPAQVESRIRALDGVADVRVILTFDPPYTMEMMSEEARLELGLL